MKTCVRIGTSGWNYDHWKNLFYPAEWPKRKWLQFYARIFTTVEVNATFYRLPLQTTFENWKSQTPEGFLMAVKANRYITHVKRLRDPDEPLERFFGVARSLGEKLGPVLFQLPPSLAYDQDIFAQFCQTLNKYNHRCVLEVRHASWLEERVLREIERYGIAFCISDTAGRYPYGEFVTADFVYIRLHGSRRLYASDYTDEELLQWAEKIKRWSRETYVYFDNDFSGYAPKNAALLKRILGAQDRREG